MKRFSRLSAALLFCFLAFASMSVANAQVGIYGGFSAANTNIQNSKWIYGTMFGAYYDAYHVPFVSLGLDARVAVLDGSNNINGLIGPRLALHVPFIKPYVEGLVGAGRISNQTALNYGFSAGADLTIFPRLDWRVVDYNYIRSPNVLGGVNQDVLTTGLVLRLPIP